MKISEDHSPERRRVARALLSASMVMLAGTLITGCAIDEASTTKAVFGDASPGVCGELDVANKVLSVLAAEGNISFIGGSSRALGYFSVDPISIGVAKCAWTFGGIERAGGELGVSWIEMNRAEWDEIVAKCGGCEAVDGVSDGALKWATGGNFVAYAVLTGDSIGWAYLFPSSTSALEYFRDGDGIELAEAASAYSAAR